jgi:hypothetical protein
MLRCGTVISHHSRHALAQFSQRIEVFHNEQKFPLETEIDEPVFPFQPR